MVSDGFASLTTSAHGGTASDIDLLRDLDCIIDLNTEVTDGALDLRMSKQQLDCTQVAGAPVDQHGLCASQRVGAKLCWIEPYVGHLIVHKVGAIVGWSGPASYRLRPANRNWPDLSPVSQVLVER
jgi:hypothetical protein